MGDFWVASPRGYACEGNYNPFNKNPTIIARTTCNDGRTGSLVITRSKDGLNGTATASLSDGTSAQFAFGYKAVAEFDAKRPKVVPVPQPPKVYILPVPVLPDIAGPAAPAVKKPKKVCEEAPRCYDI